MMMTRGRPHTRLTTLAQNISIEFLNTKFSMHDNKTSRLNNKIFDIFKIENHSKGVKSLEQ